MRGTKLLLVAAVTALSTVAFADSLTLSVGDYHRTALGLQEDYPGQYAGQFDWLDINSYATPTPLTINYGDTLTNVPLNPFVFTVGVNASIAGNSFQYQSLRTMSAVVDGVPTTTVTFAQPYSVLISSADTLTLYSTSTFQIPVGTGRALFVTVSGHDPITQGIGAYSDQMTATIQYAAVPEATTMMLGLAATMPILTARRRGRRVA